jgi:hypothetical protein
MATGDSALVALVRAGAKRGLFYRPVKQQLTLRLDADVVAWFKRHATSNEGTKHASIEHCASTCRANEGEYAISGLTSLGG